MFKKKIALTMKNIIKSIGAIFSKSSRRRDKREDSKQLTTLCENTENLHAEEMKIIHNLQALTNYNVSDIMTPRTDIMGVDDDFTLKEIYEQFVKAGHSKLVVHKRKTDDDEIIGYIALQDILPHLYKNLEQEQKFSLKDILKPVAYIPSSMGAVDLLSTLKSKSLHIAVVLDEYGTISGIVTKGTLIEELIGHFEGVSTSPASDTIEVIDNYTLKVGGRAEIDEVEKILGFSLSKEYGEYETFGGFILSYTGSIPDTGEKISYKDQMIIHITNAENRKINEAVIHIQHEDED